MSSRIPAARAAGPTAPSRRASSTREHPDAAESRLEGPGELELTPGRARIRPQLAQPGPHRVDRRGIQLDRAAADRDAGEQEAMPERLSVDLLGPILERGEGHRARSEPDAGADRADVVQVVVDALELEQHRPRDPQLAVGLQAGGVLDRLRVGQGIRDRARCAGALDVGQRRLAIPPSAARSSPRCL